MRSSRWASALLAPIFLSALIAGCGRTAATPGPSGAECGGKGQADVVVELTSGKVVKSCVPIGTARVSALDLMHRSGIEYALQQFSFGDAVCQIDHQPAAYSNCLASGQPYWALYIWSGKGPWKLAQTGVSDIKVKSGQALGWHFGNGSPSAPPKPPLAS